MAEAVQETPGGENRGGDRRGSDRRKVDRRAPPPVWRRSWALVAYGVIGSLLIVAVVSAALGDGEDDQSDLAAAKDSTDIVAAPAPVAVEAPPPAPNAAPEAATGTEDFERLSLEGDAALGRVVRAQLFCEAPSPVALVEGADTIPAQLAPLVDAERRVPAAVCWWGRRDDPRREEFLLVVPPARAAEFSSAPVVMDGYVRRRHLIAHVQWMGKTRALALRTAGVFQGLGPQQQRS